MEIITSKHKDEEGNSYYVAEFKHPITGVVDLSNALGIGSTKPIAVQVLKEVAVEAVNKVNRNLLNIVEMIIKAN